MGCDGLTGFSNLSHEKIKKNIYKERVLEKRHKLVTTRHRGGINYKNRFQKNVTRRVHTI